MSPSPIRDALAAEFGEEELTLLGEILLDQDRVWSNMARLIHSTEAESQLDMMKARLCQRLGFILSPPQSLVPHGGIDWSEE